MATCPLKSNFPFILKIARTILKLENFLFSLYNGYGNTLAVPNFELYPYVNLEHAHCFFVAHEYIACSSASYMHGFSDRVNRTSPLLYCFDKKLKGSY